MVVFDTNIFIYVANSTLSRLAINGVDASYASVSYVEALGFHRISVVELRKLKQILQSYDVIDLTQDIIETAVILRQNKKMSLGDAIIAASALDTNCELWTANIDDFRDIEGLKVYNPLTKERI